MNDNDKSKSSRRRLLPDTPQETLEHIRQKMESVAHDFSEGRINRAQFNAMYGHYSERRSIIERLIQRDPQNKAWKQVAAPGHTSFLRSHFEAHPVFYVVFRHHHPYPLNSGGTEPEKAREQVGKMLKALWNMPELPRSGLARKAMGGGNWMVLAVGELSATIVIFSLQPSTEQQNLVRDLQADFERANRIALSRQLSPEKMVFPQRALLESLGG